MYLHVLQLLNFKSHHGHEVRCSILSPWLTFTAFCRERAALSIFFCSCNFICQKASINIVKKGLAKLWETRQVKVFLKCNFLSYWCSLSGFLTPYNQGTFATNIFPYTKPHKRQNISLQKKHISNYLWILLKPVANSTNQKPSKTTQ